MKLRKTIKYWIQIIFYNLYSNYLNNFNTFLGASFSFLTPIGSIRRVICGILSSQDHWKKSHSSMAGGLQWSCNKKRGICQCNKIETAVPKNHSSIHSGLGSGDAGFGIRDL